MTKRPRASTSSSKAQQATRTPSRDVPFRPPVASPLRSVTYAEHSVPDTDGSPQVDITSSPATPPPRAPRITPTTGASPSRSPLKPRPAPSRRDTTSSRPSMHVLKTALGPAEFYRQCQAPTVQAMRTVTPSNPGVNTPNPPVGRIVMPPRIENAEARESVASSITAGDTPHPPAGRILTSPRVESAEAREPGASSSAAIDTPTTPVSVFPRVESTVNTQPTAREVLAEYYRMFGRPDKTTPPQAPVSAEQRASGLPDHQWPRVVEITRRTSTSTSRPSSSSLTPQMARLSLHEPEVPDLNENWSTRSNASEESEL